MSNIPITPGTWSRLNTFTMDGADHRGKDIMLQLEMRPETKARRIKKKEEKEKEEQKRKRIHWDKTREGSQWAEDKKEEYRVMLEERVEEMDETPSWKELAEAVTITAEEICGRQPRSSDIPCLESMKPEILRIRKCVADSYFKVQECRGQPNEIEERERHKGVKKWARNQERKQKSLLIKDVCCELDWSIQNHDTGRVYKNIRELCKHLNKVTMRSVEDITAEQARNHFLKIGGEPALQFEQEVLEHVQQRAVREDLGKIPDDAEILEAMKQMKESAAGLDEVSIGMLTSGGENTMRKVCAIVKNVVTSRHR